MPFDFESLVGYLYVVSGRSISTTPPGALVEVAPKKAARGRETDTFFTLVLPSGDATAAASFYERLAQLAADRYFGSSGSVTAGLRDVFTTLNNNLIESNQQAETPQEANILCAVLRGTDLIIGRVGCAAALVLANGRLHAFPENLQDDDALYIPPLGIQPVPNIKMTQYHVTEGARVIFGDTSLAELNRDQIHTAMMSLDVAEVLVGLKNLARLQATMMVIEFVPPGVPSSPTIPEGQSTTEISAQNRTAPGAPRQPGERRSKRKDKKTLDKKLQDQVKQSTGHTALGLARFLQLLNKMTGHFFGRKQDGGRGWLASPIGAGMAFLLPLGVVAAVILLWITETGTSEGDLCVQEVHSRVELANSPSVVNSDRQTIMDAWNLVLAQIDDCESSRPNDPELAGIRRDGREILDNYNQILRRQARVIESLPGEQISRLVAQGQTLYALDETIGQVYQITLSADGLYTSRLATPIREMRPGVTVSGIEVGEIFDIAIDRHFNIIAIDTNGVLIECTPRFLTCEGSRLLGADEWVNPIAITTWNANIYILDTGIGDGQILRYTPSGGNFSNGPSLYFGSPAPVIRNAVDFAIDDSGSVYVLLAEGVMRKYRDGGGVTFEFTLFPDGQDFIGVKSFFLDGRPQAQRLYIVDQYQHAIYQTSLIGRFQNSYHTFDESLFDLVSSAVVVPFGSEDFVYAASGNTVFILTKE